MKSNQLNYIKLNKWLFWLEKHIKISSTSGFGGYLKLVVTNHFLFGYILTTHFKLITNHHKNMKNIAPNKAQLTWLIENYEMIADEKR